MNELDDRIRVSRDTLTIYHIIDAIKNKKTLHVYGPEYVNRTALDQYAKIVIENPRASFNKIEEAFLSLVKTDKELYRLVRSIHKIVKGNIENNNSVKGFNTTQLMIKERIINQEGLFSGYVQVVEDLSDEDRIKLKIRVGGFDMLATMKRTIFDDNYELYCRDKIQLLGVVEYELDKVKMNIIKIIE